MKWLPFLLLCACEPRNAATLREANITPDALHCYDDVCLDTETGCQYLVHVEFITPRLDATGRPMCGAK